MVMLKKRIMKIYAQNISCQVKISMKIIMKICNVIIIKICVKIYCMPGTLTASSTTGFIFSMWTASLPACWSVTSSSSSSTINHHLNLKGLQERLGRPA